MTFKHLFTPHEIRGLEIKNRIFSSSHQTILARNGAPSEDMAAYHEARARGGAGLIIMESSRPVDDEVAESYYLNTSNDDCIPGYRMVADAVHRHGTKVFGQINHGSEGKAVLGGERSCSARAFFVLSGYPLLHHRRKMMSRWLPPTSELQQVRHHRLSCRGVRANCRA